MGVDFIREQSGEPWRKRWDKGLDRLKTPGLFDIKFSSEKRTVTADLDCSAHAKVGDQFVVQLCASSVFVCRGQQRIGGILSMPAEMQSDLAACGGVALGTVERVGLFGQNVELSIR
jgi:hypothetical protein